GTSTGGVYSLSGTIGQPDAGGLSQTTGGSYTLAGGFWSIVAVVPTAGAPSLTILHSGSNVIVSWPSPATGFGLEQNTALSAVNWIGIGQVPNDDGTNKTVTLPISPGNRFYRLKKS